jgi:O-methyltransferase involved in polyketide biosynthesis
VDQVRVRLTGAQETLLATLYGRALDARAPRPILRDAMAAGAVDRIDADFKRTGITPATAKNVAVRAKQFDDWTADFLAGHERAIVLHLGAGLDTRVWRVAPGPGVTWYDVDYPEVVALRRTLYPERDHYRMIGSSVTGPDLLEQVPAEDPVLVVAEGLTMYLTRADGHALFRRVVDHFPHGTLAFDAFNRTGLWLQQRNAAVRRTGATLHWAVDDARELERAVPGLRCVDALSALYTPGAAALSRAIRVFAALVRPFPALRDLDVYYRYTF